MNELWARCLWSLGGGWCPHQRMWTMGKGKGAEEWTWPWGPKCPARTLEFKQVDKAEHFVLLQILQCPKKPQLRLHHTCSTGVHPRLTAPPHTKVKQHSHSQRANPKGRVTVSAEATGIQLHGTKVDLVTTQPVYPLSSGKVASL